MKRYRGSPLLRLAEDDNANNMGMTSLDQAVLRAADAVVQAARATDDHVGVGNPHICMDCLPLIQSLEEAIDAYNEAAAEWEKANGDA